MDGYAVSNIEAKTYILVDRSLAGSKPITLVVDKNHALCVYVTTGASVPEGFTAVVPIENTKKEVTAEATFVHLDSAVVVG
jgi:molybdopterin biosynthesis enzyme